MFADLTGTYSLQSARTVSAPSGQAAEWKLKPLYDKLRGRPNATLDLRQGSVIPGKERYALSGTLTAGKTKFVLEGTARINEARGALFDRSELSGTTTGRLVLKDEGTTLEVKVCQEQQSTLTELLVCRFAVVSRPARRDSKLVGQWQWSEFYSSGGFSSSVHRFWVFAPTGRVLESRQSFASSQLKESDGSWAGLTSIESRIPVPDRGTWEADGHTLKIEWDDGKASEFRYEVDRDGMLLRWSGGQRYWKRL
jgi:hypothetical protein